MNKCFYRNYNFSNTLLRNERRKKIKRNKKSFYKRRNTIIYYLSRMKKGRKEHKI